MPFISRLSSKSQGEKTIQLMQRILSLPPVQKCSKVNIPGIDLPFVMNSTTALEYDELPKSITIIGGGVIGMEFAFYLS